MIAMLRGTVTHSGIGYIILDVNGVGYRIHASADTLSRLRSTSGSKETRIWTHLAIRENAHELYGFLEEEELTFFEMLIGISGIGPKSALGILSLADVTTLRRAIAHGDTSYLTRVSGIGKKNADKIVLELRDKIGTLEVDENTPSDQADTYEALRALGYGAREARDALAHVSAETTDTGEQLKTALRALGARR